MLRICKSFYFGPIEEMNEIENIVSTHFFFTVLYMAFGAFWIDFLPRISHFVSNPTLTELDTDVGNEEKIDIENALPKYSELFGESEIQVSSISWESETLK